MRIRKLAATLLVILVMLNLSMSAIAATGYGPGTTPTRHRGSSRSSRDYDWQFWLRRQMPSPTAYIPEQKTPLATYASNSNTLATTLSTFQQTLNTAINIAATGTVRIAISDASAIQASIIQNAFTQAKNAGVTLYLYVDIIESGKIVQRYYFTKETVSALSGTINFSKDNYYTSSTTSAVAKTFNKLFGKKVVAVNLADQNKNTSTYIKVALKADLSGLNTNKLVFHVYNRSTNKYSRITAPNYWIDSKGFLHLTVPVGNNLTLIISN